MPMLNQDMAWTRLASGRVRYVGEPVAVIVSTSREAGVDAAELVVVDYEPLTPWCRSVTLSTARHFCSPMPEPTSPLPCRVWPTRTSSRL